MGDCVLIAIIQFYYHIVNSKLEDNNVDVEAELDLKEKRT